MTLKILQVIVNVSVILFIGNNGTSVIVGHNGLFSEKSSEIVENNAPVNPKILVITRNFCRVIAFTLVAHFILNWVFSLCLSLNLHWVEPCFLGSGPLDTDWPSVELHLIPRTLSLMS